MPEITEPNWIRKGGTAAVSHGGFRNRVDFVEIGYLTKTQIVLVDGRRFRRSGSRTELGPNGFDRLADPCDPSVVASYAREQLRAYAREAGRLVSGSGATVNAMTAVQVEHTLDDLHTKLQEARKELARRMLAGEAASTDLR